MRAVSFKYGGVMLKGFFGFILLVVLGMNPGWLRASSGLDEDEKRGLAEQVFHSPDLAVACWAVWQIENNIEDTKELIYLYQSAFNREVNYLEKLGMLIDMLYYQSQSLIPMRSFVCLYSEWLSKGRTNDREKLKWRWMLGERTDILVHAREMWWSSSWKAIDLTIYPENKNKRQLRKN